MIDWNLFFHLTVGLLSTLIALGTHAWLRRHPSRIWTLVAPAIWVLCLAAGTVIADYAIGNHPITVTLTYVAIAAGGFRLTFLLAPRRSLAWIATAGIIAISLLTYFDLFQPFIRHLDSFTLSFLSIRISLLRMFEAIFFTTVLLWITHAFQRWLANYLRHLTHLDMTIREWLVKLSELVLYCAAGLCVLAIIGIDVTTLAVFGGALGVGMGMGLQKIVSNYISGLILLFEKTVKVGDVIELEGGPSGRIYRLDPRGTFLLCSDGREVIVPNEEFVTKKVTNWTYTDTMGQISIPIGIAYGSDVEKACQLMLEAAQENPLCLSDPPTNCFLKEFATYAIRLQLQYWIADITTAAGPSQSDVMLSILRKFKEAGIKIPVVHSMAEH
jgi:small-conductance mechanosensitive channel